MSLKKHGDCTSSVPFFFNLTFMPFMFFTNMSYTGIIAGHVSLSIYVINLKMWSLFLIHLIRNLSPQDRKKTKILGNLRHYINNEGLIRASF